MTLPKLLLYGTFRYFYRYIVLHFPVAFHLIYNKLKSLQWPIGQYEVYFPASRSLQLLPGTLPRYPVLMAPLLTTSKPLT